MAENQYPSLEKGGMRGWVRQSDYKEDLDSLYAKLGRYDTELATLRAENNQLAARLRDDEEAQVTNERNDRKYLNALLSMSSLMNITKIPCWIGSMPLPYVDNINIAWSERALKFRAFGTMFLAHQAGQYEGIGVTVEFRFFGPTRHIMLHWLDELRLKTVSRPEEEEYKGTDKEKEIMDGKVNAEFAKITGDNETINPELAYDMALANIIKGYRSEIPGLTPANIVYPTEGAQKGSQVWNIQKEGHTTISFISRPIVLRDIYIESVILVEDAQYPETYTGRIFIRKYIDRQDIRAIETSQIYPNTKSIFLKNEAYYKKYNLAMRMGSFVFDLAGGFGRIMNNFVGSFESWLGEAKNFSFFGTQLTGLVFSPNPGFVDLSTKDWDCITLTGEKMPIFGRYKNMKFLFMASEEIKENIFGMELPNNWIKLNIKDEVSDEIIFSQKIVKDCLYSFRKTDGTKYYMLFDELGIETVFYTDRNLILTMNITEGDFQSES